MCRGSRDGDKTKIYHKLYDNKKNILIIIKANKGFIFDDYCKIWFTIKQVNEYKIELLFIIS